MANYFTVYNKPQVRQEGFHLPSPAPSATTPPPHQPISLTSSSSMDFSDEIASLISSPPGPTSHERTTTNSHSPHSPPDDHSYADEGAYRPTHNIFDISAPSQHQQHQHQHHQQQQHQQHNGFRSDHLHEFAPQQHFNSTLPALNSSLRYDPDPPYHHHQHQQQQQQQHQHPHQQHHHNFRQTPSPIGTSRSRSRSRGPSVPPPPSANTPLPTQNSLGPTRNVRQRRGASLSSSSPPPRPQAIVIPGSHRPSQHHAHAPSSPLSLASLSSSTGGGWFLPPASASHQSPSDYLPTPDSLGSHALTHGHMMHHPHYATFGLSPPDSTTSSIHHTLGTATGGTSRTAPSVSALSNGHHPASNSPTTTTASSALPASAAGISPNDKQALLANEKRRRRRESHNAVERRRRDNINEKISELATLIPECMLDPSAGGPAASANATTPISPADDPLLAGLTSPSDPSLSMLPTPTSNSPTAIQTKREPGEDNSEVGVVRANKGMILRKSVEYIRYLQQLVSAQATRNRELEAQLAGYRGPGGEEDVMGGGGHHGSAMVGGGGSVNGGRAAQMHTPTSSRDSPPPALQTDEMGMMLAADDGSAFSFSGFSTNGNGGKQQQGLFALAEGGDGSEMDGVESGEDVKVHVQERGRRGRDDRGRVDGMES